MGPVSVMDPEGKPPRARRASPALVNALTVDVEDWFHLIGGGPALDRGRWASLSSRVEANTRRLLSILSSRRIHGTFFFLGWIAERYPHLVQEVQTAGHEIGVHGFWHDLVHQQTPKEFGADLDRAIEAIEAAGARPTAYRAPSFSITPESTWAFQALAERGITIDSSVFPTLRDGGGYPGAPLDPYTIETPGGAVREFPLTVLPLRGLRLPVSGGGYLRAAPWPLFHWAWKRVEAAGRPGVLYIHPRDLDPGQPRPAMPFKRKLKSYVGLRSCQRKLESLLDSFTFEPLGKALTRFRDAHTGRNVL